MVQKVQERKLTALHKACASDDPAEALNAVLELTLAVLVDQQDAPRAREIPAADAALSAFDRLEKGSGSGSLSADDVPALAEWVASILDQPGEAPSRAKKRRVGYQKTLLRLLKGARGLERDEFRAWFAKARPRMRQAQERLRSVPRLSTSSDFGKKHKRDLKARISAASNDAKDSPRTADDDAPARAWELETALARDLDRPPVPREVVNCFVGYLTSRVHAQAAAHTRWIGQDPATTEAAAAAGSLPPPAQLVVAGLPLTVTAAAAGLGESRSLVVQEPRLGLFPLHLAVRGLCDSAPEVAVGAGGAGVLDTRLVRLLLASGSPVDGADDRGRTPLHWASHHSDGRGAVAAVRLLLAHGADVRAVDADLCTPLHNAARWGYASVIKVLLAHAENTPSGTDTQPGCKEGAKRLGGGFLSRKNANGATALHLACLGGHSAAVEMMLGSDAMKNGKDDCGWRTTLDTDGWSPADHARRLPRTGASAALLRLLNEQGGAGAPEKAARRDQDQGGSRTRTPAGWFAAVTTTDLLVLTTTLASLAAATTTLMSRRI